MSLCLSLVKQLLPILKINKLADGPLMNIFASLKLYKFTEKSGDASSNMLELVPAPKLAVTLKSFSLS